MGPIAAGDAPLYEVDDLRRNASPALNVGEPCRPQPEEFDDELHLSIAMLSATSDEQED